MDNFVLEMSGITKTFPGVKALNHVDFRVKSGEIHGLIGENGAGKSTLMNVLMGIYKLDEGQIKIKGNAVEITSPTKAISYGIGMVPQELNLNSFVSVAENVFLGNEVCNKFNKIDWTKTNEKAITLLKAIGVDTEVVKPNFIVDQLSVAQQQLVQISRVLATGADLLVFDEPTASLTASETEFLLDLMKRLKEQGKSIIFITHHLEELLKITDNITVMRDGCLVAVTPTSQITVDQLIDQMAGRAMTKVKREKRIVNDQVFLKVENFSRSGEFKDVSFDVKKGEIFGIGGLVGAGRTELINAIYGLTKKSSGTLFFEGKKVDIKNPTQAIKLGFGYVTEERRTCGIFPVLSVCENTVISIYPRFFKKLILQYSETKKVANQYVKKLQTKTPSLNTPIKSLSGGNQQKVILSRWLSADAKLLILDEPTRGIDVNAKGEIYNLIFELANKGVTIIVISSEAEELLLLADRVMVMHEGRVKGIRNASELEQKDIISIALKEENING